MSACSDTQRAITEVISLADLADAHTAHAAGCAKCRALLGRYRQLDGLTRRSRRVLADLGDLPPNDWVRIREGVDREVERRRPWLTGALLAAAAALAVVAGVAVLQPGQVVEVEHADGLALNEVTAPGAPQVALAVPTPNEAVAVAAMENGAALTVAPGDVLKAGETPRTLDAFGRHHVTLAANTELRVRDWSANKMALEVVAGEVTCDVNRTLDEDIFEVVSGDVTVHVLGTVFTVARGADGATRVGVERGRVGVVEGTGAMRELSAGESATFGDPTEARVDELPGDPPPPRREAHRGPRVIQIDVPDQRMDPSTDGWTGSRAFKAIVKAIDDGNCRAAMKALDAAVEASRAAPIPASDVAKLRARCGTTSQP